MLATVAVLGIGLIASTLFWYRSEQQRHDATMQSARAEAVVRFLSDDLIGALSPCVAGFACDPTVRDILLHAAVPYLSITRLNSSLLCSSLFPFFSLYFYFFFFFFFF